MLETNWRIIRNGCYRRNVLDAKMNLIDVDLLICYFFFHLRELRSNVCKVEIWSNQTRFTIIIQIRKKQKWAIFFTLTKAYLTWSKSSFNYLDWTIITYCLYRVTQKQYKFLNLLLSGRFGKWQSKVILATEDFEN